MHDPRTQASLSAWPYTSLGGSALGLVALAPAHVDNVNRLSTCQGLIESVAVDRPRPVAVDSCWSTLTAPACFRKRKPSSAGRGMSERSGDRIGHRRSGLREPGSTPRAAGPELAGCRSESQGAGSKSHGANRSWTFLGMQGAPTVPVRWSGHRLRLAAAVVGEARSRRNQLAWRGLPAMAFVLMDPSCNSTS